MNEAAIDPNVPDSALDYQFVRARGTGGPICAEAGKPWSTTSSVIQGTQRIQPSWSSPSAADTNGRRAYAGYAGCIGSPDSVN